MSQPRVVMCSMWRNDADRHLADRVEHLLLKAESWPNTRFLWLVADSCDNTGELLYGLSTGYDNVTILEFRTDVDGDDASSRLRRLSQTANRYFENVQPSDDLIVVHESDIASPYDLLPRLITHAQNGYCPIAGWPVLEIRPGATLFYDCWAYRRDGQRFSNHSPYHPCYRSDRPFELDSFGTLFMMDARDAKHIHMNDRAVLDLCRQLKEQGRTLWCDPALKVIQPRELWEYKQIDREYA